MVVPSKIPNLARKRGQIQDSWACPSKTVTKLRNLDVCGKSEKSPVEALGSWHLSLFYVLCHILGVANKIPKIHTVWQKN